MSVKVNLNELSKEEQKRLARESSNKELLKAFARVNDEELNECLMINHNYFGHGFSELISMFEKNGKKVVDDAVIKQKALNIANSTEITPNELETFYFYVKHCSKDNPVYQIKEQVIEAITWNKNAGEKILKDIVDTVVGNMQKNSVSDEELKHFLGVAFNHNTSAETLSKICTYGLKNFVSPPYTKEDLAGYLAQNPNTSTQDLESIICLASDTSFFINLEFHPNISPEEKEQVTDVLVHYALYYENEMAGLAVLLSDVSEKVVKNQNFGMDYLIMDGLNSYEMILLNRHVGYKTREEYFEHIEQAVKKNPKSIGAHVAKNMSKYLRENVMVLREDYDKYKKS